MHCTGRGAAAPGTVIRRGQARAADVIAGAGHSLGCTTHLWRVEVARGTDLAGHRGARRGHARDTLQCPHAGPVNASGWCPKTLLVSGRRGGGAAPGHVVTQHPGGEPERESTQPHGRRALGPEAPRTVRAGYRRQEPQAGSPRWRPVRRQARSLRSAVRQKQSAGGQRAVPA